MIGNYLDDYTFEYLINSALNNVPDTVDKREGSIIYDALAPACYELASFYMNLKRLLNDVFVETAGGEYLDKRASEQGLTRYAATKALVKGEFTTGTNQAAVIPIGSRFSTINGENSVNFVVTEAYVEGGSVEAGSYVLQCEEFGTTGNNYLGDLMTITNINNLGSAQITSVITPARDIETDVELRNRFLLAVKRKPFGGNIAQYDSEIKSISGVGDVQVYPTWNGGGTVKCSVISSDYGVISNEFIEQIQEAVDPSTQGSGLGLAPIGHTVTITTPTAKVINITATINTDNTHTLQNIQPAIMAAIGQYLLQLRQVWGVSNDLGNYALSVYIARINYAILSVPGVSNVTGTQINGSATDLVLTETGITQELPVLGTVTLNE